VKKYNDIILQNGILIECIPDSNAHAYSTLYIIHDQNVTVRQSDLAVLH